MNAERLKELQDRAKNASQRRTTPRRAANATGCGQTIPREPSCNPVQPG